MQQLSLFDLSTVEDSTPVYSSQKWERTNNGYLGKFEIWNSPKKALIRTEIYSPSGEYVSLIEITSSDRSKAESEFTQRVNTILESDRVSGLNETNHLTQNTPVSSKQNDDLEYFFIGQPIYHLESSVGEQVPRVTPCGENSDYCVGEQVSKHSSKSAHQHIHWVEPYWVERSGKRFFYFRYTSMTNRKMERVYIGSIKSNKVSNIVGLVKYAITCGKSPQEIKFMIKNLKNMKSKA
jgi:hypothetical protein